MRKRTSLQHQRGYLMILAILFILVIGFLGIASSYMIAGSARATVNFQQAEAALGIAEAGLEQTIHLLYNPVLTGTNARIGCSSITGNTNLTNKSFATGTFTATLQSGSPIYVNTTLSSAITANSATIPVTSTTGFANAGRIMIDGEIINYGGISGNSFVGVQRGANENYNTPHAKGAAVSQYQCNLDINAGIPNLTSSTVQREINEAVQLQEGWAAASVSGSNFILTRWNRPTEVAWTNSSAASTSAASINSISMLSNADGWAVGAVVSLKFTLLHWNGTSWSLVTSPTACTGQDLTSVVSVYSNEAWAVGPTTRNNGSCTTGGTRRYTVLKWNGTSWATLTPSTSPAIPADSTTNQNLNSVHVIDATQSGAGTIGFAVGVAGTILEYNGIRWTAVASPTTNNLNDVFVVSATEAWAVGDAGTILKWNGSTWSLFTSHTTTRLRSIIMLDYTLSGTAKIGWAVGDSGTAVTYNGTSWSVNNTGSSANLFGVDMFFTTPNQDVWAVGTGGTIMHYNGTTWSSVASNVTTQLNSISLIKPQPFPFAYKEVF